MGNRLGVVAPLEVLPPEFSQLRVVDAIEFHTVKRIDERTRESTGLGSDANDPVESSPEIEVPCLRRQSVRRPDTVGVCPRESLTPPPAAADVHRCDGTTLGAGHVHDLLGAGNLAKSSSRILRSVEDRDRPTFTTSPLALAPPVLDRRPRAEDGRRPTLGKPDSTDGPNPLETAKRTVPQQRTVRREPAEAAPALVPDKNGIALEYGELRRALKLPGPLAASAYAPDERPPGVEEAHLRRHLLEYGKATIGQSGAGHRSRPLILRLPTDLADAYRRRGSERERCRPCESLRRQFADRDSGGIPSG